MIHYLLVALSLSWLPSRGDADVRARLDVAVSILATDATAHEARILMRVAALESGFRQDVADCRVTGDGGRAVGPWQHLTRSAAERAEVCSDLGVAARVALVDVRRSVAACRHLPAAERLAVYARGRCSSVEGRRLSRERWAE